MRKFFSFLILLLLAAAVWLGARAFVHRGEIRVTIVFDQAAAIRSGDPVVESGAVVGHVVRVENLDGRKAVTVRLSRDHRRAILHDSLFAVGSESVIVTNTFAIGAPIDNGAILEAKEDRVSRWLATHGSAVASYVDAVRAQADRLVDDNFSDWDAHVPEWKREGSAAFDEHIDALKREVSRAEADLEARHKMEEARKLKVRFERWLARIRS